MVISALLLSYCHKKQENLFAPLRLCVSARDILVAAIRVSALLLSYCHKKQEHLFASLRETFWFWKFGWWPLFVRRSFACP
jgi:hypothetical protein